MNDIIFYYIVINRYGFVEYSTENDWVACDFCAECNLDYYGDCKAYDEGPYKVIKVKEVTKDD